ncbi:MAG: hypothetical protein EA401_00150 [Planctomycetota bacterium]|nr:MAG: hypothetical protein EA401_00150 [Planctomycetota bacterium]
MSSRRLRKFNHHELIIWIYGAIIHVAFVACMDRSMVEMYVNQPFRCITQRGGTIEALCLGRDALRPGLPDMNGQIASISSRKCAQISRIMVGYLQISRVAAMLSLILCGCTVTDLRAADRSPSRALEAAEQLHRSGENLDPVVSHLQQLLRHDDPLVKAGAALYVGHALFARDRIDDALEIWTRHAHGEGVRESRWGISLSLAMAQGRHRQGNAQDALVILDDLISVRAAEVHTDMVRAADLAGRIHAEHNQSERARRAWRWAIAYARRHFSDPAAEGLDMAAIRRALRDLDTTPSTADAVFSQAERQRGRERWTAAQKLYEQIVEEYPHSQHVPASRWAIGVCMMGAGRLQEAATHWRSFIDEDPSGPWRGSAMISLGDLALEHRLRIREAKHFYRQAQDLFEGGAEGAPGWDRIAYALYQRLGLLAYLEADRDAAIAWFERASRRGAPQLHEPGDGSGPVESAMDLLIGSLRDGNDLTPEVVRRTSNGGAILCLLGDVYGTTHELDQATRMYRRVIAAAKEQPEDDAVSESAAVAPTTTQIAWAHRGLGNIHYVSFEFNQAQEHYAAAIAIAPRAPWADDLLIRRGVVAYSCQSQPEEALAHYRRVLREYPRGDQVETATYFIAVLHHWEGHFDAAERLYRDFLRRYPRSTYAESVRHYHLAELKRDRAQADKQQAAELGP